MMKLNPAFFAEIAKKVVESPTMRTSIKALGKEIFHFAGMKFVALQQNPATNSSWAGLARSGHRVVQFKNAATNRYVGVSVDGQFKQYP
jgi:hypothetical protein